MCYTAVGLFRCDINDTKITNKEGLIMKWFEDIFTKSKLMIISGILGIVGYFALAFISIINPAPLTAQYFILAVLPTLLLICYAKGQTSCQKALIGAILGIMMYAYWGIMAGFIEKEKNSIGYLELFMTIFLTIMFVNHLLLQIDHKGDTKIIKASQIILVVAIVLQLAETLAQIINKQEYYMTLNSLSLLCTVTMITCVESRVQKYKARRSAAMKAGTWTEEERQKSKKIFKF